MRSGDLINVHMVCGGLRGGKPVAFHGTFVSRSDGWTEVMVDFGDGKGVQRLRTSLPLEITARHDSK